MKKLRKPIVAGNWKMNGTKNSINQLINSIKSQLPKINSNAEMIVFPPFVFLDQVSHLLNETSIQWGGQNLASEIQGAFTGEISAQMLQEFGCHSVLVGHSERRQLYGESNELVAKKVKLASQSGLKPILCVGETLEQREAGQTQTVVAKQLNTVLDEMDGADAISNVILAYEPVWAIGTGLTATPEQAQEVHAYLREQVTIRDRNLASSMRILYGGSVKASNAAALFAMEDIDGGLIGGASLDAEEFINIYKVFE